MATKKAHRHQSHRQAGLAHGAKDAGCRVAGRLWIEQGDETYLSWGRVVLLERIREHGSISAAARSMEMGYRHAWELVASMNQLAPEALVEKAPGGAGGGGAQLTPAGEAAIEEFWRLVADFRVWLQSRRVRAGRRR
jgi:molybdate transport system regulatory protein